MSVRTQFEPTKDALLAESATLGTKLNRSKSQTWVARFGLLAIIFFMIKGLLWLLLPLLIVRAST